MIRKYRVGYKEASLQEVLDYLEEELKRGGNTQAFEELGVDFRDVDELTDLDPKLQERIKQEYAQLEKIVGLFGPDVSIKRVYDAFDGHNLDKEDERFDLYWGKDKNMIVTVYKNSEGFYLGQIIEYCIEDMFIELDTGSWVGRDW